MFSLQGDMVAGSDIGHHPLLLPGVDLGWSATVWPRKHKGSNDGPVPGPASRTSSFPSCPKNWELPGKSSRLCCWRSTKAHEWRGHRARPAQLTGESSAIWLQLLEDPKQELLTWAQWTHRSRRNNTLFYIMKFCDVCYIVTDERSQGLVVCCIVSPRSKTFSHLFLLALAHRLPLGNGI